MTVERKLLWGQWLCLVTMLLLAFLRPGEWLLLHSGSFAWVLSLATMISACCFLGGIIIGRNWMRKEMDE